MCGIVGILNQSDEAVSPVVLKRMTDIIAHRGPDGDGFFHNDGVGLGHRRLAIIDLSPAGNQPRMTIDGRYVITFNGEIYNFQELRVELESLGHHFNSRTDTEVLLNAYAEWGVDSFGKLNGMFAFAIWDRKEKKLCLARDRFGVKPLYYYHKDGVFIFASEIKAILEHPKVSVEVNVDALSEYFTFQNIFSDRTMFQDIHLLPAGVTIEVTKETRRVDYSHYWDYNFSSEGFDLSYEETKEQLYHLFEQAVTRQLISDVPVGSYLSGGMDSGSITAIAARSIPRIHTFTCGFDLSSASGLEMGFDERPTSEMMANVFGTEHYEMVLHAGDMEHVLPNLIWHLEDLRVGQSYPNYYVSRLASKFVKVVLSGSGGDELFAGYPWRYFRGVKADSPQAYYRAYYDYWQRLIQDEDRANFFNKSTYLRINENHPREVFQRVFSQSAPSLDGIEGVINASLYFEIKTFLNGLFIVEDKLSMAHSLETRVPFMDNDLVDFVMKIPPRFKLRDLLNAPVVDEDEVGREVRYRLSPDSDGKVILRDAMRRLIPEEVSDRRKQGFSAPDASWFRGESIEYVSNLLKNPKAHIFEYISPEYVNTILHSHTQGRQNYRLLIWSLLSFEWWLKIFVEKERGV